MPTTTSTVTKTPKRTAAPSQMQPPYKRRVSFDSLSPSIETTDRPLYSPPQYRQDDNGTGSEPTSSRTMDLNYGFETALRNTDITKVLSAFQEISRPTTYSASTPYKSRKKAPKLLPPPEKSNLKTNYKDNNNYVLSPLPRPNMIPAASLKSTDPRKKSIVDMTPEELMALDQQYRKPIDPSSLKFGGDEYLPAAGRYIGGLTSLESRRAKQIKNIDKFGGYMSAGDKPVLTPSLLNYKSYVANYRHEQMSSFIEDHYARSLHSHAAKERVLNAMTTSLRDMVVYISGRQHTWSALDWTIKNFLEEGDNLILICQVPDQVAVDPLKLGSEDAIDTEYDDDGKELPNYKYVEVDDHYGSDGIQHEAERLLKYFFAKLNEFDKKDLKVSVTVELIREKKVSNLLKKAVALHSPQVFITSSLVTQQFYSQARPLRLPFYISNKLAVPTIIVPHKLIDHERFLKGKPLKEKIGDSFKQLSLGTGISILVDEHEGDQSLLEKLSSFTDSLNPTAGDDYGASIPSSRSESPTRSSSSAATPSDYLGPTIKFADQTPFRSNNGSVSNGSLGSRRNSNSSGIYKVKSLLDTEPPIPVARSKSQTTPLYSAVSGSSLDRTLSRNSLQKSKSEPQEEKKGLLKFFSKKKSKK